MYETLVTIVGNALHEPEWRKTVNTGALVTTFKLASTARRFSRELGKWTDGNSLRVRVTCWRTLAENVKESVTRGDPLIVHGRMFTRDWVDREGITRTQYELEALSVGHDLSRGRAVFERNRPSASTSAVEDVQSEQRLGGELTESVPDDQAPARFNPTPFDVALDQASGAPVETDAAEEDAAVRALRSGGLTPELVFPAPGALTEEVGALSPVIDDEPEPVHHPIEGPELVEVAEPPGGPPDGDGQPSTAPAGEPSTAAGSGEGGQTPAGPGRRRGSRRASGQG